MELIDLVSELKKYVEFSLFLGSGATVSGGGPTGKQLKEAIKRKHPEISEDLNFFETFDRLIDRNNSNRAIVEEEVREILSSMAPTDIHRYLLSLPIRAIITTNYDKIPELVSTTLDGNRSIITVLDDNTPIDIRRRDRLYCFKLFGDMEKSAPDDGYMVLNNADRRRAYSRQKELFKIFGSLARSGIIVYLGYSFDDELVFDILEDMLFELKNYPHKGFLITRSDVREEIKFRLQKNNITIINGSIEEFIELLKDEFGDIPVSYSINEKPIRVHGKFIDIEKSTLINSIGKFTFINQGSFESTNDDPINFLEGKDNTMVPYQIGWDFPRKIELVYSDETFDKTVLQTITKYCDSRKRTGNPSDNQIIALIGPPGSGKTVLSKRIAFEWYSRGNPVIFLNPDDLFLDVTAIEHFLDEIWSKYRDQIEDSVKMEKIRYLIICDKASSLLTELIQLNSRLISSGKPVDILLIDRSSELNPAKLEEMKVNAVFTINKTIDQEERIEFLEHVKNKKLIENIETLESNIYNPLVNTSFFALLYTSIRELQRPLSDIIIDDYFRKTPNIQRLMSIISLIESYGFCPYYTITTKTCNQNFYEIMNLIREGELRDVIWYDDYEESFFTNHRIIAEILRSQIFKTPDMLANGLSNVIQAVDGTNLTELTFLHNLLIRNQELNDKLSSELRHRLFTSATSRISTRPLLLHQAITELNMGDKAECKITLAKALKTKHPIFHEPDNHVFDVKGRLELQTAKDFKDAGEYEKVWDELLIAEGDFLSAKVHVLQTPHPFFGLAQTYCEMALFQDELLNKFSFCLNALRNITELKLNGPSWFILDNTISLEKKIFDILEAGDFNGKKVLDVYEKTHNADGYAYLAEKKIRESDLDSALNFVNEGLDYDPKSLWLLRLRINLLNELAPENIGALDRTYELYIDIMDRNYDLILSFELAKHKFKQGDWDRSMKIFEELSQRSKGHKRRIIPGPNDRWISDGRPKQVIGSVIKMPTLKERGEITCDNPRITYRIPVREMDFNYEKFGIGDTVSFEIVFNMVGPQASNVNKR